MADPQFRSMNGELLEGSVDGTYKRVLANYSNYPGPNGRVNRERKLDLNSGINGYGVFESPEKRTPDGRFAHDVGRVHEDTFFEELSRRGS